jgi:Bacterial dnaA protein helix-turn-helix
MSAEDDLHQRYREVRKRLISPSNAVPDEGIDLKRNRSIGVKGGVVQAPPPQAPSVVEPQSQDWTPSPTLTIASTVEITAQEFGLDRGVIMTRNKKRWVSRPRQVAMYIATTCGKWTPQMISMRLGRDRTTVLHARAKIASEIDRDPEIREKVRNIEAKLVQLYPTAFPANHQYYLENGSQQDDPSERELHQVD